MFTQTPARRRWSKLADALVSPNGFDRYAELVVPTWSSTEIRGRVAAVARTTDDTVTLTIEPNRNWPGFTAGQYTQLSVDIDGVRHTRCYSMASAATETRSFELTVKAHPHGLVSRHLVAHAEVGMVVRLTPPAGEFTLPDPRPDRLLLISGGSGITPVLSMLRTLCAEGHARAVTFVHYALTPESMTYGAELEQLAIGHPNVRVVRVFTDAPGTGDLDGFLTAEQLDRIDPEWATVPTFVCGPAPLMDSARALYEDAGAAGNLHTEAFTLASFVAEAGSVDGALRFDDADVVVDNDGRTILEQAEAAGLSPESGCRMGICHTCTRSLVCGTVRDAVTGELTSGTDVAIRVCVSVPVGDTAVAL